MDAGRVLIVDDDPRVRSKLGDEFRDEGYATLGVSSFDEVLRCLADPDLALILAVIDLRLEPGEEGGLAVLDLVYEHFPGIPAVILTAMSYSAETVEAMRLDPADYLLKPATASEILEAVKRPKKPRKTHSMEEAKIRALARAIIVARGNQSATARLLGVSRSWVRAHWPAKKNNHAATMRSGLDRANSVGDGSPVSTSRSVPMRRRPPR